MTSIRYIGTACAIVWSAAHYEVAINGSSAELLYPLADLAAVGAAASLVVAGFRAALTAVKHRPTMIKARA